MNRQNAQNSEFYHRGFKMQNPTSRRDGNVKREEDPDKPGGLTTNMDW